MLFCEWLFSRVCKLITIVVSRIVCASFDCVLLAKIQSPYLCLALWSWFWDILATLCFKTGLLCYLFKFLYSNWEEKELGFKIAVFLFRSIHDLITFIFLLKIEGCFLCIFKNKFPGILASKVRKIASKTLTFILWKFHGKFVHKIDFFPFLK